MVQNYIIKNEANRESESHMCGTALNIPSIIPYKNNPTNKDTTVLYLLGTLTLVSPAHKKQVSGTHLIPVKCIFAIEKLSK